MGFLVPKHIYCASHVVGSAESYQQILNNDDSFGMAAKGDA